MKLSCEARLEIPKQVWDETLQLYPPVYSGGSIPTDFKE